jgi:TRAP-type transport system periplasmic protein
MNYTAKLGSALIMAGGLAVTGQSAAQTKWDVAAFGNSTVFQTENVMWFGSQVEKLSQGKVKFTFHPDGALFKQPEIKRAVQGGQAQMGEIILGAYANEDPLYGIDTLPFLVSSYPEGKRLWGMTRDATEKRFAKQGMKVLFATPWPPQGLFSNKPIKSIADIQGLKFRVYSPVGSRLAELLKAQPVTIQPTEVTQAMATGLVNINITSSASAYDQKAWEAMKHFYDMRLWIPKNMVFANQQAFNRLDKATQTAMLRAAAEAEERGWKISEEKNGWYIDQLRAKGMDVTVPPPALMNDYRKIGNTIINEWMEKSGPESKAIITQFRK